MSDGCLLCAGMTMGELNTHGMIHGSIRLCRTHAMSMGNHEPGRVPEAVEVSEDIPSH